MLLEALIGTVTEVPSVGRADPGHRRESRPSNGFHWSCAAAGASCEFPAGLSSGSFQKRRISDSDSEVGTRATLGERTASYRSGFWRSVTFSAMWPARHVPSFTCLLLASLLAQAPVIAQSPAKIEVSKLGPQVGERVPDFSLKDQNGTTRTLQGIMGPKGAMLVFFRSADW